MMDKEDHDRNARERDRGGRRDRPTRFSSSERDRSVDRGKDRGGMKSSQCRVYVSNIPYEYRWQDLKDLFRQQVGEVSFVELFVDEHDKARGCGIIEFAEPGSAKKCLEVMHRFELKGRKIVIKEDFGNQRDKYGNLIGSKRRDRDDNRDRREERRYDQHESAGGVVGGGGVGGRNVAAQICGNTYGLSPAFLDDLKIQTPLNTRIFVANLDYKVDKKKLKEVFRMAGKVTWVDMPLAKDGSSRGFAVIEYDHPVESVQAISMFNGQPLYDRPMTVRMDRGPERDKLPDGLKTIGPGLGTNGEPLRDVARNLPSLVNQPSQAANINSGPGILGAVPNLQLNAAAANALGSLSGNALGNLNSTPAAVLQQTAGLNLPSNLLASTLGNNELANLMQSNAASLAALAASTNSLGSNNFTRNDSVNQSSGGGGGGSSGSGGFMSSNQGGGGTYGSGNGPNMGMGQNMNRNNYQTGYESSKPAGFNFGNAGGGGGDRDGRQSQHNAAGNMYNSMNNGGSMMRNAMIDRKPKTKLLITNLPPTAHYKLITEKCQEFGTVENVEEQGQGTILVNFMTEWDAERAMKNIDRARIDGRTIDARIL